MWLAAHRCRSALVLPRPVGCQNIRHPGAAQLLLEDALLIAIAGVDVNRSSTYPAS